MTSFVASSMQTDDTDGMPDDDEEDMLRQMQHDEERLREEDDGVFDEASDDDVEHDDDSSCHWRPKRNDNYRRAVESACGRAISIVQDECTVGEQELLERIAGPGVLPPTAEQRALVVFTPAEHQRVVVNAYAGAGKTLACRMLATRFRPPWRPLYIVFNKEAAVQARRVMPKHVGCHTTHAFALAFMRDQTKWSGELSAAADTDNARVAGALAAFWHDPIASDIVLRHVPEFRPESTLNDPAALEAAEQTLRAARKLWRCMTSNSECEDLVANGGSGGGGGSAESGCSAVAGGGRVPRWTFDAVLKYMALHRDASYRWIEERFDCVLVDEAQDTQQVLIGWYRAFRRLPVYFVGDMHQSIYGFTGCRNAMEQFVRLEDTRVFHLTQSFRFGQNLAHLATLLLKSAGMLTDVETTHADSMVEQPVVAALPHAVRGRSDMHCVIVAPGSDTRALQSYLILQRKQQVRSPVTFISRSNAVALDRAFDAMLEKRRVRILGCLHEQVVNAGKLVETRFRRILPGGALQPRRSLWQNKEDSGDESDDEEPDEPLLYALRDLEKRVIAARRSKTRLVSDAEKRELEAMRVIKKFGSDLTLQMVREALVESDSEADVIVGTAHSTKGLEFDLVVLGDDFYPLSIMRRFFASIGTAEKYDEHGRILLSRAHQKHFLQVAESNEPLLESVLIARRLVPSMAEPGDAPGENNQQHTLSPIEKIREEVHLYYVAMTRARHALVLNNSLYSFYGKRAVEQLDTEKIIQQENAANNALANDTSAAATSVRYVASATNSSEE